MRFTHASLAAIALAAFAGTARAQDDPALEHRLDNGLRVLVLPRTDVPLAYCWIGYVGGSSIDPAGKEGMAELVRRLSFNGNRAFGTEDPVGEENVRREIEKTVQSRENLLAKLPREILEKLNSFPRKIQETRERISQRLRSLGVPGLPPMSRPELTDLLDFVLNLESEARKMEDEIAKIKATPLYRTYDLIRVLDKNLAESRRKLDSLLVPDPLRSAYRQNGALSTESWTEHDALVFEAVLPANRIELFFWIECRRFRSPVFRFFNREKELAVAVASDRERRRASADIVSMVSFPDHAYCRPALGTEGTLAGLTAEEALEHGKTLFEPGRARIVVIGDVDPDTVFYLAERYFGSLNAAAGEVEDPPVPAPAGPLHLHRFAPVPHVEIRYLLPGGGDPRFPALECFAALLSAPENLPRTLRAFGGATGLQVRIEKGRLASLLVLGATPAPGISPSSVSLVLQECVRKLAGEPVPPDVFEKARRRLGLLRLRAAENPRVLGLTLLKASLCGAPRSVQPSALATLGPERVEEVARALLADARPVLILTEDRK